MNALSDDVERCRRGDPAAAEALARRACRLALRTSGAILRGREEAADVARPTPGRRDPARPAGRARRAAAALHCRRGTVHALLSHGRAGLRADPQLAQLAPGGPR